MHEVEPIEREDRDRSPTIPLGIERNPRDPSRYVKRSAHLPHLGEDADHELIDDMELLRSSVRRR